MNGSHEIYHNVDYKNKVTDTTYQYLVDVPPDWEPLQVYLNRMGACGWCLVSRTDDELILCKLMSVDGQQRTMETVETIQ